MPCLLAMDDEHYFILLLDCFPAQPGQFKLCTQVNYCTPVRTPVVDFRHSVQTNKHLREAITQHFTKYLHCDLNVLFRKVKIYVFQTMCYFQTQMSKL